MPKNNKTVNKIADKFADKINEQLACHREVKTEIVPSPTLKWR